jgi:hypothetical protein
MNFEPQFISISHWGMFLLPLYVWGEISTTTNFKDYGKISKGLKNLC